LYLGHRVPASTHLCCVSLSLMLIPLLLWSPKSNLYPLFPPFFPLVSYFCLSICFGSSLTLSFVCFGSTSRKMRLPMRSRTISCIASFVPRLKKVLSSSFFFLILKHRGNVHENCFVSLQPRAHSFRFAFSTLVMCKQRH
jgi:hypothetical protein